MSTKISNWPAATPLWVDLGVDHPEAAKAFYADLFGWEFVSGGQEAGGYQLAQLRGRAVAGMGPKQDPGTPTSWTTFLASDDVDLTAKKIVASGGQLLAEPFDVDQSGRMALAADSSGATFGVWQAGTHIGAERVNEHGALCWNELHTRDYSAARSFYAEVFDVSYQDVSEEGLVYSTIRRPFDGREVGGVHHDTALPDHTPNYWMTWFASDYVAGTATRAVELGATLLGPVEENALGRMVVVRGPQGEVFGVIDAPRTSD
ncbi:VOC family protein [Paenarthrobacter nicotinovorans]|uniref:VOC family protein n=1 Tax=Paenarthrobacter nicotinovorans TaxID=29320 RepID=A0ABV0GRR5_PAENI|nr:VOC family protein [Paenarthrobacter nicotinovorans]